jgi:hypothetical protein
MECLKPPLKGFSSTPFDEHLCSKAPGSTGADYLP